MVIDTARTGIQDLGRESFGNGDSFSLCLDKGNDPLDSRIESDNLGLLVVHGSFMIGLGFIKGSKIRRINRTVLLVGI